MAFHARLLSALNNILTPSENLPIVQWAEQHFILSTDDSAEAGAYRASRAPYQREVLEAIGNPESEEVVLLFSSQVGKTLLLLIACGYFSHQQPSPLIFCLPDVNLCEDFSKRRLSPSIRNSPALRKLFSSNDTPTNNTILSKFYPGGSIFLASANIVTDLTSRPIRVILADEIDKMTNSAGKAGDPLALLRQRSATFYNRKIVISSTPLIKGESKIENAYLNGSQGVFNHSCIHCNAFFAPKWSHVNWDLTDKEQIASSAKLICPHCAGEHNDSERQISVDCGKWIHAFPSRRVKSFFVNAISSPWVRLSNLVEQYITALNDPMLLRQFTNEILGESYEYIGARIDNIQFGDRIEPYTTDALPNGILFLTAGVDVQGNRLEGLVLGWGKDYECWVVKHIIAVGKPSDPKTWDELHNELQQDYVREDGGLLRLLKVGIDTGGNDTISGGFSQFVKNFISNYPGYGYMPFKGASTPQKTIFPHVRRKGAVVYLIDTQQAKDFIYTNLTKESGAGVIHFNNDCAADFFNQLTSEEKIKEVKNGRTKISYQRIKGRDAEILDCWVYGLACRLSLPSRIESQNNLKTRQKVTLEPANNDYLLGLPAIPPPSDDRQKPVAGVNRYSRLRG